MNLAPPKLARSLLLARALMYLTLVVVGYLVLRRVAVVIAPVITGLFLAYLINPIVERLERRVPRPIAIAALLMVLAAAVTALGIAIPSVVSRDVQAFAERWHETEARLETVIWPWARRTLHLSRSASVEDAVRTAATRFAGALQGATGNITTALTGALSTATGLLRLLLAVLLTPVFAIYFLSDYPRLQAATRELIPPRHRAPVLGVLGEINHALASWLRGQLTVMVVLGTLYATGLSLVGVPLGLGIGLCTGLMAFVPYVGVVIGLGLALVAALLDVHPAQASAGVLATFAAVQALDAMVITPRILGGRVGLSPVAVIFALSLGGELLGYAGLLLAVPCAAVAKVLLQHAHRAYVRSPIYATDHPAAVPPVAGDADAERTVAVVIAMPGADAPTPDTPAAMPADPQDAPRHAGASQP